MIGISMKTATLKRTPCKRRSPDQRAGFSIVELLIAMFAGLIVIGSVYSIYMTQLHINNDQRIKIKLQQNLRTAMVIMEQEIRMIGFDPEDTGQFGIVSVGRYDLIETHQNKNGSPALFYTLDEDENGALDGGGRNKEHCSFRITKDADTGRFSLTWDRGGGRRPVADGIVAMGLAYGVDSDHDGQLDCYKDGQHLIWAVSTKDEKVLDTHIDVNDDGRIDAADFSDGDDRIDGIALDTPLSTDAIKAVRVWLLAQSSVKSGRYKDDSVYVVGDRLIRAANDGYMRQVLSAIIDCRNL